MPFFGGLSELQQKRAHEFITFIKNAIRLCYCHRYGCIKYNRCTVPLNFLNRRRLRDES